jgi:hypothetical protein
VQTVKVQHGCTCVFSARDTLWVEQGTLSHFFYVNNSTAPEIENQVNYRTIFNFVRRRFKKI